MTVPVYNMTDTWNAGATVFSAISMTVTNTAAANNSNGLFLGLGTGTIPIGSISVQYQPISINANDHSAIVWNNTVNNKIKTFEWQNQGTRTAWVTDRDPFSANSGAFCVAGFTSLAAFGSMAAIPAYFMYNTVKILTFSAAATVQAGPDDAASPTAQTWQHQSVVAGTSNTAGVDWTFNASKGTGTGTGGKFLFKTAGSGSTGTSQNPINDTALTLQTPTGGIVGIFSQNIQIGAGASTWAWNGSQVSISTTGSQPFNLNSFGTAGIQITSNAILTSPTAATLQQGAADAAAPVAQILQVQSVVAGTTNTAGTDWTIKGSKGTGSGAGGKIIFQTAPCSSGTGATAQNPYATGFAVTASSITALTQQPSVVLGSSQLASSASEGFLYITTVSGPPTGTPTTYTGRVPIVYDSSNNKLYIFNSSGATWVGGTAPGTWS